MEFKEIIKKTKKIKEAYAYLNKAEGYKSWGLSEHVQGLVGDVGDLTKLMMASEGFRFSDKNDVEAGMAKELADCLLSVMMIAGELDVDLEKEILKNIKKLEEGISDRKVIKKK
jgi:NTP pyrophosphatase (non-canonical NTP hydrolase)